MSPSPTPLIPTQLYTVLYIFVNISRTLFRNYWWISSLASFRGRVQKPLQCAGGGLRMCWPQTTFACSSSKIRTVWMRDIKKRRKQMSVSTYLENARWFTRRNAGHGRHPLCDALIWPDQVHLQRGVGEQGQWAGKDSNKLGLISSIEHNSFLSNLPKNYFNSAVYILHTDYIV
jgi:hypothetical protein